MLNKIIEEVNTLYKMDYASEEDSYQDNYKKKRVLINFLIHSFQRKEKKELAEVEYNKTLDSVLETFSSNTGCAEDLEILFDQLHEMKIISTSRYREVIESSAVNRWL